MQPTTKRKEIPMTQPHTAGPWRVFDVLTDIEIVTDSRTANETESLVQFKGQRNARANARLMAAAPELLASLVEASPFMPEWPAKEKARAAIAKAEGKAA
jgi:hypothetical protein